LCTPTRQIVSARVADAETGRPLPGAMLMVMRTEMLAAADSFGVTPGLEAVARDSLVASHPGYLDEIAVLTANQADPVRLALYRDAPRAVAGLVRSSGGFGIDSAVVALAGTPVAVTTTSDGSFLFPEFPAGPQTLVASRPDFPAESMPVFVAAGETSSVDFALHDTANEGTLAGVVFARAGGAPVPSVEVSIRALHRQTRSGADGRYSLGRVPAGEHLVSFAAPGFRADSVRCRVTRGWSVSVDVTLDPVQR
jgi:hypothetical protein